jgi:hypothetical protein
MYQVGLVFQAGLNLLDLGASAGDDQLKYWWPA